jgi:lipopolysaccharide biosynthesis regulator YciM
LAALDHDFAMAEDLLARLVRLDSNDIDVYLALGRVYRDRGEIGRAIALHQTLVLRRDLDVGQRMDALSQLAADFQRGGFTRRALAAYDEVLEHDGRRVDALRARADLLVAAGEPARALDTLGRLERYGGRVTVGERADLLCTVARRAREDGRIDAARRAVRKALRADPQHVEGQLLTAELALARGRTKPAIRAYQVALDVAPERAVELLERAGRALIAKGQRPLYEQLLRDRLARQTEDLAAGLALADLLSHDGRADDARTLLQSLLAREPDHVAAHMALGRILLAGAGTDPQLADRYRELLDALDHGRKGEVGS